ncbi:DUF6461 domain-containing protein [Dactylosporangium sp. NPDC005572]|uniref:DUF6461 domain-containing protein n=1 Tax=Dactylosporangium sp. NPDC005572 TaxID=3156889 RepID=UPI0033B2A7A1
MEEVERYRWVDDSVLGDGACVTFVEGMDLAAVAEAFGGSIEEATDAGLDFDSRVALRQVGGWVVAAEVGGWQGSRGEVLRRLTGGRAVSCYWNINAVTRFRYAGHGTVVTEFEALFPDDRGGADPEALELLRADLPWGDRIGSTHQLMFALAARITGVELAAEMIDGPMVTLPLRLWPEDVVARVLPRYELLTHEDPELSAALQRAGEATLRMAARLAAGHVARAAGMLEHPAIAAVVAGEPAPMERLDALARHAHGVQARAVAAARACTSPSALAAAFRAVTEAGSQQVRDSILEALGSPQPPGGSGGVPLDEHWLGWDGCATYVHGLAAADVAAALGADPDVAGTGPVTLSTRPLAWVRTDGEWVVVLEPGRRPRPADRLLERLSAGGEAVQAEWSTTGNVWFRHAVGGALRTRFNGYAPERAWGTEPHALRDLVADLPIPRPGADGGGQAAGLLALAARMTGVEIDLDGRWRAHHQD